MKTYNRTDAHQLMAIITCEQSDGYLKNWAREKIRESEAHKTGDIVSKFKIKPKQDLSRDQVISYLTQ
jgi:hypothetical protein